ncbi:hypothetical protein SY27_13015 [Flavobacterium sp. 316]|uniref:Uncharacterized protein n=2 Tax=Flavobacteriaceae TaxID=49546 RepID=A0ABY4HVA7_9FLAO|nr:hypothetical protein [Flavobacterium sp. 316]KIX20882.1 hypothetical protein SY27_13015 [Flavobacterium sp. 316]UOX35614.1 hypothetical protein LXD69_03740 [Flavobacterium sediminilitoris]
MQKYRIVLFLALIVTSCQLFDKKVPDKDELLQEELEKINWKEVDQFPTAFSCDSIMDKELQKQCFFENIIQSIQERISADTLQILYPEIDTIDVKVTINPDATLKFEIQKPNDSISYDIKVIDSILQVRLSDFPPIEPAIKRGIKVKSQFILPVVINIAE